MTTVIPDGLVRQFDKHCDDVLAYVDIARSWPRGSTLRDGALRQAQRSLLLAEALRDEACA